MAIATDCLSHVRSFIPHERLNIQKIVCLGLGPVRDSRAAQLQLAFLLLLREVLVETSGTSGDQVPTVAFDPIFDEDDWAVLSNYSVLSCKDAEEDDRLVASQSTVFFMPHCERTLYEKLWSLNSLRDTSHNVILIGNDHQLYDMSATDSHLAAEAPSIARLLPRLKCYPIPDAPKPMTEAFQSQAFQWVADAPAAERLP
ncbi:hypothetical protein K437DRAFT_254993 [Tilletiaria anomala UBC 951]|uniref:SRR1-like domain-containing protein n=1 Tax=Tilletiaria anomala (strain ATCC 24038 / CBS 436.72 / UBC 951) TaxID=1037660 RepID=A0A066WIH8_TILAU|nr:uncharacterized protein K437DRAFT_254993 [Tilletiaria anomala UBC 951]KDN50824.1 hypothetical protein K437DRAFT_254993 [Tilletiaria anomala UBC 951]